MRILSISLSLMLGFTSFVAQPLVFDNEAEAQSRNSFKGVSRGAGRGVSRGSSRGLSRGTRGRGQVVSSRGSTPIGSAPRVFNNPTGVVQRRGFKDQLIRDVNNPLFVQREIFNAVKGQQFGLGFGNSLGVNRNDNIRLIQREIQIQDQNAVKIRQNELRQLQGALRRTGPNGRFLTREEQAAALNGALIDDSSNGTITEVFDSGIASGSSCPSGINCGFRVYSDGTGPRIITPGISGGLPSFDGLNGPKVITLD